MEKEKIELGDQSVIIDPELLSFNENTLSNYIETEGSYYDNFGGCLALAERLLQQAELRAEKVYGLRFADFKDNLGGSDKLTECRAKSDDEVVAAEELVIEAKYKVKRIQQHIRAWDKNHDNAQSMGHMLRKQIDKLQADIFKKQHSYNFDVDELVGHIDDEEKEES
jgi:hypothetical protein